MALSAKFLNSILMKKSLSSIRAFSSSSSISQSRKLLFAKFDPVTTWMERLESPIRQRCSKFQSSKSNLSHLSPGRKLSTRSFLSVSFVIGSVAFSSPRIANAMDGFDILLDDHHFSAAPLDDGHEGLPAVWMFVRKLWLPAFFFLTVLVNLEYPIMLVTKAILFLLTTKPSPLSVYVLVERLCHQSMRQEPHLYLLKSLYANKVEVYDYKLLCLATVEVKDEKFTLVGILGGWWALPLSQEASSVFWDCVLY